MSGVKSVAKSPSVKFLEVWDRGNNWSLEKKHHSSLRSAEGLLRKTPPNVQPSESLKTYSLFLKIGCALSHSAQKLSVCERDCGVCVELLLEHERCITQRWPFNVLMAELLSAPQAHPLTMFALIGQWHHPLAATEITDESNKARLRDLLFTHGFWFIRLQDDSVNLISIYSNWMGMSQGLQITFKYHNLFLYRL